MFGFFLVGPGLPFEVLPFTTKRGRLNSKARHTEMVEIPEEQKYLLSQASGRFRLELGTPVRRLRAGRLWTAPTDPKTAPSIGAKKSGEAGGVGWGGVGGRGGVGWGGVGGLKRRLSGLG